MSIRCIASEMGKQYMNRQEARKSELQANSVGEACPQREGGFLAQLYPNVAQKLWANLRLTTVRSS